MMPPRQQAAVPVPERELPAHIVRAHDRYLIEVVEGLALCPFAHRAREQKRVVRRFFRVTDPQPDPAPFARVLDEVLATCPEVEIALLAFLVDDEHPWRDPRGFDEFLRPLREAHESSDTDRFYLVTFHPDVRHDPDRPVNADGLVPLIRRTPDPLIQCTRASVLERVRRQAREKAPDRIVRDLEKMLGPLDAAMRAVLSASIQTDSRLSTEIAEHNFRAVGEGEARARFEALIASILAERRSDDP